MYKDSRLKVLLFKFMQILPDSIFLSLKYCKNFGQFPHLKHPVTFNEKLQWLKLHNRKSIYTIMVDKFEAKKYVSNLIGDEYIIPTFGVWEKADDINFDNLPNKFVMKTTHDSGRIIICHDKSSLNVDQVRRDMEISLKRDFFNITREWPYKNVPRKILAEKLMVDESGSELKDYKFFCFDGVVKFFKIDFDRSTKHHANYSDCDMNLLDFGEVVCPPEPNRHFPRPIGLDKMIELAGVLSKGMPFVRVDFYNIEGKIFFGEITFFPNSGMGHFIPEKYDKILGDMINLPFK